MPRVVDPYAAPVYRQVADALRAEITTGRLPPGSSLPSANDLAGRFGIGVDAARDAMAVLRAEGLVESVRRGARLVVREPREYTTRAMPPGARIRLRMPTPDEMREHDIPEGVPVAVVRAGDGEELYIGDRDELVT